MNRAEKRRLQKLAKKRSTGRAEYSTTPAREQQAPLQNINLALQHHAAGRLSDARHIYQKILASSPGHPVALHHLGIIAHQEGDNDSSVDLITKAIEIDPGLAESHNNLGYAYQGLGRLEEAITSFGKAIALNPRYVEALNNLGNVLKAESRFDEALVQYYDAVEIRPDSISYSNIGYTLQRLGRLDEALSCYQKSLEIKPDDVRVHNLIGDTYQQLGFMQKADNSYKRALAIDPVYTAALQNLARLQTHTEHDEIIQSMEQVFSDPNTSELGKMNLAFGLGKSFEDLQRYDKAFAYIEFGNTSRRKEIQFSIDQVKQQFENLKKLFVPDFFEQLQGAGSPDPSPIFVLGMPRSGTTLVEQILASHPDIYGAGELGYLADTIETNFGEIDDIKTMDTIRESGPDTFLWSGEDYIKSIRKLSQSSKLITDKMPGNFQHIGMIKLMIPNAKIIHCCRDPKDTCLSIFKTQFVEGGLDYAYDQQELGRYYNLYQNLMAHWSTVLPDFIFHIQYENLIADQENESRALIDFCGLDWNEDCLEFHKTDRAVQTASVAQVRKPIYNGSVQLWKRYEKQLAPLLQALSE